MDLRHRLRAPDGHQLLKRALQEMTRARAPASLQNLELWARAAADPEGAVAQALGPLVAAGGPITDEALAPLWDRLIGSRGPADDLGFAGDQLSRQIEDTTRAIGEAQRSQAAYGRVLATAGAALEPGRTASGLAPLVGTLAKATQRVQDDGSALEQKLAAAAREVRELRASLHLVKREARTDALTALANRKAFDERLAEAVAQAEAEDRLLALALIDIDHFKRFNDTWGHQTGDEVIRYVATVLAPLGIEPRLAARYGGEEFALVLPQTDGRAAMALLEKMRKSISARRLKRKSDGSDMGSVTISAGLANFRRGDTDVSLIRRADNALYVSKNGGRNRVSEGENDRRESAWG